jgi:hypothetical protein
MSCTGRCAEALLSSFLRCLCDRLLFGDLSQHLVLRCKGLSGERSSVTVITASLAIMVASVGIEAAAMRVGGQDCGKKNPKAESELYDQQKGFHGVAADTDCASITPVVATSQV